MHVACLQRIRRVATDNRVFLSLDLTSRDGLQCVKDSSAEVALDDADSQFRAFELTGMYLILVPQFCSCTYKACTRTADLYSCSQHGLY